MVGLGLLLGFGAHVFAQSADTAAVPGTPVPLAPLGPTNAAGAPVTSLESQAQLEEVEKSLSLGQDKVDQLHKEITDLNGDRDKQNAALIAAGQRLKIAEIEVNSMQERLSAFADAEAAINKRLDGADAGISNMLAALERISLNPPPALIVDPSDALGSARGAMLISAIVPQLKAQAAQVVADLQHLADLKKEAESQAADLKANYAVLESEQVRVAALIEARKQGIDSASGQLTDAEQQVADLGTKATALRQTVAAALSAQAAATAASAVTQKLPAATPDAIRVALADSARTAPAIPFNTARGYLTIPADGTDVQDYGVNDGLGGLAKGISYTTPPRAKVVAPADGWVLYKGPYLNYGQIVILNPGQDYTILLAGLDAVDVAVGQFVREGEPLGTMGSRTIAPTLATSAGATAPTLYIELRKNDQPVDPTGWWAPPANTTQSG